MSKSSLTGSNRNTKANAPDRGVGLRRRRAAHVVSPALIFMAFTVSTVENICYTGRNFWSFSINPRGKWLTASAGMIWPVALEQALLQTRRGFRPHPGNPAGGPAWPRRLPGVSSEEPVASCLIEAWLAADPDCRQIPLRLNCTQNTE